MNDELKPCPFCKCSYDKDEDDYFYSGNHKNWCPLRGTAYGGYGLTVPCWPDAIAAWNTRADDAQVIKNAENYKLADDSRPQVIANAEKHELADSRERLRADVYEGFSAVDLPEQMRDVLRARVHGWLDRQEAITSKEWCYSHDALEEELERVRDERDELREELEDEKSENGWAREFLNRMGPKCGTADCPSLVAYVNNLEAERDELNAKLKEAEEDIRDLDLEGHVLADKLAAAEDMLYVVMKGGEPNYDEWMWNHDGLSDWFRENFTKTVPQLTAEVEVQRKRANDAERGVLDGEWYVSRDRYEDDIAELTAERNELRGYAAEKIAELAEKQHVIDVQRELFRKMERELAEAKAADFTTKKDEIERLRVQVAELKAENRELCMKVYGAPF